MRNRSIDTREQQKYSVGELLALTVPLMSAVVSLAWAVATYFIVREVQRARVEVARIETERK